MTQHPAIKIMPSTGTASEWYSNITHARSLGAVSRDNDYGFNPARTAIVIRNNYITRTDATKKSVGSSAGGEAPTKISTKEFWSLRSLHDVNNIGKPQVDCSAKVEVAVNAALKEVAVATPTLAPNLKITDCTVLTQNPVIFNSQGVPAIRALGVDITMLDGVPYIIDIATNSASPLTTEFVAEQVKADLLDGEDTPWVRYANQFQLVTNIVMDKILA